jgi:hypothetical protein
MCSVRGSSPMDSNGNTWAYPLRVDRSGPVIVFESQRRTVSHSYNPVDSTKKRGRAAP